MIGGREGIEGEREVKGVLGERRKECRKRIERWKKGEEGRKRWRERRLV